jgi:hypothetical protein
MVTRARASASPGEGLTITAYKAEPGTPSHDGLKLPASLTGLGPRTGQATLVAAWYAGLTALALAFAYRGRDWPPARRGHHHGLPGLRQRAGHPHHPGQGQPRSRASRRDHRGRYDTARPAPGTGAVPGRGRAGRLVAAAWIPGLGMYHHQRAPSLGHSNSPYFAVCGHSGSSPACRLPPAPGDRRSELSSPP